MLALYKPVYDASMVIWHVYEATGVNFPKIKIGFCHGSFLSEPPSQLHSEPATSALWRHSPASSCCILFPEFCVFLFFWGGGLYYSDFRGSRLFCIKSCGICCSPGALESIKYLKWALSTLRHAISVNLKKTIKYFIIILHCLLRMIES